MAEYAPLIASFLHQVFILANIRIIAQDELVAKLDDELFALRETTTSDSFPRNALEYLNDWADNDRGWLRKFYPPGSDEPHFDLTPAAEKAIAWLESLLQRSFVGTESRLLTLFDLLRQMVTGSEESAEKRIAELEEQKKAIDREIERIHSGDLDILDDTALRERFQQVSSMARELLGDFREVEQNFRQLDQDLREKIATWEGSKGQLLESIFGERDAITDSDQGKSFRAFWDFLMSPTRQEELSELLDKVFSFDSVASMHADVRLKRIHYDMLEAGEHTQKTVARVSRQLRRYLDNQAYLENKRIMQLLKNIEVSALSVRDSLPRGNFTALDNPSPSLQLPMDRTLFSPPLRPVIKAEVLQGSEEEITASALFEQIVVDRDKLQANIRKVLQSKKQATLAEILEAFPAQHGLAEIVTYFSIASVDDKATYDDTRTEEITWQGRGESRRRARLPLIIFTN